MLAVFPQIEEFLVFRAIKRLRILYFSILAIFVVGILFMLVFNMIMVENYQDRSYIELCKWISLGLSVPFSIFSVFFWNTKYRYTKNHAKMFKDFRSGLKSNGEGIFTGFVFQIKTKDGVEFYTMKVKCEAKDRRYNATDRELLVYKEVPPMRIAYGQKVKFITHSNILLAYEVEEEKKESEN